MSEADRPANAGEKKCSTCEVVKARSEFPRDPSHKDGLRSQCKACKNEARRKAEDDASAERRADPYAPLKVEDFNFDVGVGNDGRHDPKASKEKRQEFSRAMGTVMNEISGAAVQGANAGGLLSSLSNESVRYLAALAEQERRMGNRRHARSFSLAAAHELMAMQMFKDFADRYLTNKIEPVGYAAALNPPPPAKRTVCALLSDLHIGADLGALDEPMPFRAIEEARRLEFIARQIAEFKSQYRDHQDLLLMLNGDEVEGMLMHDFRDGIPLVEQKAAYWELMGQFVGYVASAFGRVRVECQSGNHGRDKLRHPGRATSRKWDGHEWELHYGLAKMCSGLKNVTFNVPFRAVSSIEMYGEWLLMAHGDTEPAIGHPQKAAEKNGALMDNINSTLRYGHRYAAACFGHYHHATYVPGAIRLVHNGALVPPNGHARSNGPITEVCGQFIWEAVAGHIVGDLRFVEVGTAQDWDENLGKIIKPFRFSPEGF